MAVERRPRSRQLNGIRGHFGNGRSSDSVHDAAELGGAEVYGSRGSSAAARTKVVRWKRVQAGRIRRQRKKVNFQRRVNWVEKATTVQVNPWQSQQSSCWKLTEDMPVIAVSTDDDDKIAHHFLR